MLIKTSVTPLGGKYKGCISFLIVDNVKTYLL